MENENTLLDFEKNSNHPDDFLASSGMRLANFFLDRVILYVLIVIEGSLFDLTGMSVVKGSSLNSMTVALFLLSIPAYWVLFEYFFGKTPAKFLTKTKVVSTNGSRPSFGQVVGRTLCRFIPFEPLSFLGSRPVGWHDSIPDTRVVKDAFGTWEDEFV